MRIAVTVFGSTVSPLFDAAQLLLLADLEQGRVCKLQQESISSLDLTNKLLLLAERRVQVLVCGAISNLLHNALSQRGIRVYPWVSGEVDQVLDVLNARFGATSADSDAVRVAVTATGARPDGDVALSLRGCSHLIIMNAPPDDEEHEAIELSPFRHGWGECIQLARRLIDDRVQVLITGRCGPNACGVLTAAGVRVITGVEGPIRKAVRRHGRPTTNDGPLPSVSTNLQGERP
jgi:predicted Fe-Mo cluster-binding NifX family protein